MITVFAHATCIVVVCDVFAPIDLLAMFDLTCAFAAGLSCILSRLFGLGAALGRFVFSDCHGRSGVLLLVHCLFNSLGILLVFLLLSFALCCIVIVITIAIATSKRLYHNVTTLDDFI